MIRRPPGSTLFPYTTLFRSMRPGAIPEQIERWSAQIGERTKLSPLAFAGHSELGDLNLWCHIWAYKEDRKSTRLNSSHANISYAVFCLKKKKKRQTRLAATP